MINCIIIDDEPLAIEKLSRFVDQLPTLKLAESFTSAVSAIAYLNDHSVDLIFLDIEMKDLTGIQFLESVRPESKVIITTAYEAYALKGYELQVSDYLLKPITFERFVKACEKVSGEISLQNRNPQKKIFVKTEYRLEGIDLDDILYIEGMGDYRRIITRSKKIMTLQSFRELTSLLPNDKFIRVHNSYMVALDKIEKIERNRIYIYDKLIPVSETYSLEFYAKINR
ncbi:MAG: response regulator transcription factor [Bacteroidales bacterium]|nr:response regulator transcription factor [Bacteroidales bacterium]